MVGVADISAVVAAVGVFVGVALTVLELRHISRQRQTQLVVELSSQTRSKEFKEVTMEILGLEFSDYDDFVRRYGAPFSKNPIPVSLSIFCTFYEELGVLVKNTLVDTRLISQLFSIDIPWQKVKEIVECMRRQYHEPRLYEWFEYLYNETMKREKVDITHG